jgi:hypothetical protein
MPDRLRPALGLAAGCAAMLICGCGGGSHTAGTQATGSSSGATSKVHFVAQAQAICRTLTAQEKPLRAREESLKGLSAESADTVFIALVHQLVKLTRATGQRIGALPRPAGDSQAVEKLVNALSEEASEAEGIAKAADNQESVLGEVAERALKRTVSTNSARATEFGMKECIGSE